MDSGETAGCRGDVDVEMTPEKNLNIIAAAGTAPHSNEKKENTVSNAAAIAEAEPRFVIKKFNAVALWTWDMVVDNCAICRNHMMDECIECQANMKDGTGCTISWGRCNHAFHTHCISRWLKTRQVCPLDNSAWEVERIGR